VKFPSQGGNLLIGAEQGLCGETAKRTDDFGLDEFNLFQEKRFTGFDFNGFWVPISGWTAFDDVCNVDLLARISHGFNNLSQKLSGSTDKGFALSVFIGAALFRHLTDE